MLDIVKTTLIALKSDKRGVTAVEYAIIAGVLVAAIGTAFTSLSTTLSTYFSTFKF
jgi:pilus assembly protein Flp/PilA